MSLRLKREKLLMRSRPLKTVHLIQTETMVLHSLKKKNPITRLGTNRNLANHQK